MLLHFVSLYTACVAHGKWWPPLVLVSLLRRTGAEAKPQSKGGKWASCHQHLAVTGCRIRARDPGVLAKHWLGGLELEGVPTSRRSISAEDSR